MSAAVIGSSMSASRPNWAWIASARFSVKVVSRIGSVIDGDLAEGCLAGWTARCMAATIWLQASSPRGIASAGTTYCPAVLAQHQATW